MSNVNNTEIVTTDVKFHDDTIPAFIANDGEIYAAAKQVLRNIGFNEERCKAIKIKWRDDEVVSANGAYFNLWYSGGVAGHSEATFCLPHKILPLALAKISITPALKKEYPQVVEKLITYQLECADVLYNHFYNKTNVKEDSQVTKTVEDSSSPLTREELAMYFTCFVNTANEYVNSTTNLIKEHISSVDKRLDVLEKGIIGFTEGNEITKNCMRRISNTMSSILALKQENNVVVQNHPVPQNPLLVGTLSSADVSVWLKKAWKSFDIISYRTGKDSKSSLKEVYKVLRENGVQLSELYKEYRASNPGKAMINMIASSDILRSKAEDAIKQLHRKYYPEKYTVDNIVNEKPIYRSQLLLTTPDEVRGCIQVIADKTGMVYNSAAAKVYKEIENRANINLKSAAKDYAFKNGYSNCSKAYYIKQDEKLMNMLREVSAL